MQKERSTPPEDTDILNSSSMAVLMSSAWSRLSPVRLATAEVASRTTFDIRSIGSTAMQTFSLVASDMMQNYIGKNIGFEITYLNSVIHSVIPPGCYNLTRRLSVAPLRKVIMAENQKIKRESCRLHAAQGLEAWCSRERCIYWRLLEAQDMAQDMAQDIVLSNEQACGLQPYSLLEKVTPRVAAW